MTETVLFVGGSRDGERIAVRGSGDFNVQFFKSGEEEPIEIETYHLIVPHTLIHDVPCPIYLISTESPENLIPLLIEGYRRKE
jgi:hypothetical protein